MAADPTPRLRLSLGLQSHAARHGSDGMGLVELARQAEGSGFDGVVIGDHVVLGNRLDRYPYPPVHFPHDSSWMEPLSVLAAVAAVTTRLKLTTGVLVSPLRPAVLLAKTAATVDHLSGGRLELGVGVDLHITRDEQVEQFIRDLRAHAAREDALLYQWAERDLPGESRTRLGQWLKAKRRNEPHAGARR